MKKLLCVVVVFALLALSACASSESCSVVVSRGERKALAAEIEKGSPSSYTLISQNQRSEVSETVDDSVESVDVQPESVPVEQVVEHGAEREDNETSESSITQDCLESATEEIAPTDEPAAAVEVMPAQSASEVAEHTHEWEPIYTTIHHEEVGHTETTVISEAYDEPGAPRQICSSCGADFATVNQVCDHIMEAHDGAARYSSQTINSIHHDAVTEQVWIVDVEAFDEQVLSGYQCECGAEK